MDLESVQNILNLKKEKIEKLTFKQLMELIDSIKSYFISSELDIETQIELYSKAIILLMKAREKLAEVKKRKEEIDKMYEDFVKSMDQ
ncbi:MAG: exodeoxyribonuclease VII [Fervidobacterium sp.]|nr:exodeoxyribonuclease VII [Fervidobacterium sp.]